MTRTIPASSDELNDQQIERLIRARLGWRSMTPKAAEKWGLAWPLVPDWKLHLAAAILREAHGKGPTVRKRKTVKSAKGADPFYASWEWKRVRYEALRKHGTRCQACGWAPGDTEGGRLTVDHIKPRSRFPDLALDVSNLQVLCSSCNMGKSNVYTDDFRE